METIQDDEEDYRSQLEQSDQSDLSMIEDVDVLGEMAPLYLFLASSLNVELVYIILTGISKFSHLKSDGRMTSIDISQGAELVETETDSTLVFNSIDVGNAGQWSSSTLMDDLIENSFAGIQISKKQRDASRRATVRANSNSSAD